MRDASVDPAEVTIKWAERWPDTPPLSYDLRGIHSDRWVRFHSLPGSKRYADDAAEYSELLMRHNTVLRELVGTPVLNHDLLVVTCAWSQQRTPAPREPELAAVDPDATYWTSVLQDRDDQGESWTHLYIRRTLWSDGVLDGLLRLVADYQTAGVIIASHELDWLYAPYDGGADVIAASSSERDSLRARHPEWVSAHPKGL